MKPLLIVGCPKTITDIKGLFNTLERLKDYTSIVYPLVKETEIKFEVFHNKDFNETNYNELKQLILKRMEK